MLEQCCLLSLGKTADDGNSMTLFNLPSLPETSHCPQPINKQVLLYRPTYQIVNPNIILFPIF